MKQPKPHPGGPRGRQATGVHKYCVYLMPEQAEAVKELQHKLRIDSWAGMVRILIEKGLEREDWEI